VKGTLSSGPASYQGCVGIARGTRLVRVGNVTTSRLYPKNDPKNTNGTDTQNHRKSMVKKVGKGKAPEEPLAHNATFKAK